MSFEWHEVVPALSAGSCVLDTDYRPLPHVRAAGMCKNKMSVARSRARKRLVQFELKTSIENIVTKPLGAAGSHYSTGAVFLRSKWVIPYCA